MGHSQIVVSTTIHRTDLSISQSNVISRNDWACADDRRKNEDPKCRKNRQLGLYNWSLRIASNANLDESSLSSSPSRHNSGNCCVNPKNLLLVLLLWWWWCVLKGKNTRLVLPLFHPPVGCSTWISAASLWQKTEYKCLSGLDVGLLLSVPVPSNLCWILSWLWRFQKPINVDDCVFDGGLDVSSTLGWWLFSSSLKNEKDWPMSTISSSTCSALIVDLNLEEKIDSIHLVPISHHQ